MLWAFKFSILAICAALIVHNVSTGGVLQSLEFFGVKMQFAASMEARSDGSSDGAPTRGVPDVETPVDPLDGEAISAFQPSVATSAELELSPPPAASLLEIAGSWLDTSGATYEISQSGAEVRIREISRPYGIPFETASCVGRVTATAVAAECTTIAGTVGEVELTGNESGGLVGQYHDLSTGATVPIMLRR